MADFDTAVLYLENPPVSAPPASYLIGVRMKNLGIAAASASGYVQVFDKGTGLLVGTFNVASAEMDPDEEKQAFATVALDLSEAEPGQEFLFSGDITSPGDNVRSNDILNPTTITIVDEPPPPPPPVASHHAQHEDGGADELDVTGLHGVLGTAQPYADHASGHENGGADEVNVAGMTGQLADPQIAADHGNERHVVDMALKSELTNHENDETPHGPATSLEKTADKGQVDGYPELDGSARVPTDQLATGVADIGVFLRGDRGWSPVVADVDDMAPQEPAFDSAGGSFATAARIDHQHNAPGGFQTFAGVAGKTYAVTNQLIKWMTLPILTGPSVVIDALSIRTIFAGRVFGSNPRVLGLGLTVGNVTTGWIGLAAITVAVPGGLGVAGAAWKFDGDLWIHVGGGTSGAVSAVSELQFPTVRGAYSATSQVELDAYNGPYAGTVYHPDYANQLRLTLTTDGDVNNWLSLDGGDMQLSFGHP